MFCLSGVGSVLSCEVFPPLDTSQGSWEIGLVGFTTYNSIPNIEQNVNDMFHYGEKEITIQEGSYEIQDLEQYILSRLDKDTSFSLKANNNTLKAELLCNKQVHFNKPRTIGSMLGFHSASLAPNQKHVSNKPVSIIRVNSIRIECNIARGSYRNGRESHVIHEFYPDVGPGFKMVVVPQNIIYLPLNVQRVNSIVIHVNDQNGSLVNFRNEEISLVLHIRRNGSGI